MLQHERQQIILERLTGKNVLSVSDAMHLLQASPATVRRDFAIMAKEKLVRRVRGGVAAVETSRNGREIPPFSLRAVQHHGEKRAIAAAAARLAQPDEAIIVEGGTTTCMLSEFMPNFPLRIITNSVRLAAMIEDQHRDKSSLEVYVTGGILYAHTGLLLGRSAAAGIRQYHAQWLFLSTGGITAAGVSTTNEMVAEIERAMIQSTEKMAVLADFSKLGKKAMCHVCGLEEVDVLITNPCAEQTDLLNHIRSRGVEVIEVP